MPAIFALIIVALIFFGYQYWKYKNSADGAPYVPLEQDTVEAALRLAMVDNTDTLYDLGSGDGRIPIMASLKYGARGVGIELDKIRFLYSKFQTFVLGLSKEVVFVNKDLFSVDISQATVITIFLSQETNEALVYKLEKELKPGTRIVSAAFDLPNWQPVAQDDVHVTPWGPLYLYEVGVSNP